MLEQNTLINSQNATSKYRICNSNATFSFPHWCAENKHVTDQNQSAVRTQTTKISKSMCESSSVYLCRFDSTKPLALLLQGWEENMYKIWLSSQGGIFFCFVHKHTCVHSYINITITYLHLFIMHTCKSFIYVIYMYVFGVNNLFPTLSPHPKILLPHPI